MSRLAMILPGLCCNNLRQNSKQCLKMNCRRQGLHEYHAALEDRYSSPQSFHYRALTFP